MPTQSRTLDALLSTCVSYAGRAYEADSRTRALTSAPLPSGGRTTVGDRGLAKEEERRVNNHGQPYVRVSARDGTGLGLVAPARARQWLRTGKARMVQRTPCHVRLTCPHAQATRQRHFAREAPAVVGVDPGYETTGVIARIGAEVIFALEVEHRTKTITVRMTKRASLRKGRRSRRAKRQRDRGLPPKEARFDNRRHDEGWLPPSLRHLRDSTVQWVRWLVDAFDTRVCVVVESALFDPHLLRDPEVSGKGYQEGARCTAATCTVPSPSATATSACTAGGETDRSSASTSCRRPEAGATQSRTGCWRADGATTRRRPGTCASSFTTGPNGSRASWRTSAAPCGPRLR